MISYVKSFIAGSIFVTAVSCSTSRHLDYTECDNTTSFIEIRQSDYNRDTSNVNLYSGVVVDCNNIPIIGAHITIDGVQMVYTTDFDGYFHFEQESFIDDNKNVTIQYLGYEDLIISLRDIRNNSVKVVLVSHDFLLEEMVVQYPLRRRVWQRILRIFGLVK